MRGLLTRVQFGMMRLIGMRKLREALDTKSDTLQAEMLSRVDALSRRVDALGAQLSQQGQAEAERGETTPALLRDLHAKLDAMGDRLDRGGRWGEALGELRAEISGLRADLAREAESIVVEIGEKLTERRS